MHLPASRRRKQRVSFLRNHAKPLAGLHLNRIAGIIVGSKHLLNLANEMYAARFGLPRAGGEGGCHHYKWPPGGRLPA